MMSELQISCAVIRTMHPRKVFRISRGARKEVQNVFVRLSGGGITAYGEASPNAFYGESAHDVLERIKSAAPLFEDLKIESVGDIARVWDELWCWVGPSRAAQCALDLALWDWLAKRKGITVAELALGQPPHPVETFCTIGVSDPEELKEKLEELAGFPLVKVKSDARADLDFIRTISQQLRSSYAKLREKPDQSPPASTVHPTLAVDANCAWEAVDIQKISQELSKLGVAFIEQPLPPEHDARMPELLRASSLPVMADESCVTADDVARLPGRFTGFNIKLVKCGGLTPALRMLHRGRELGLKTMVGCMLESSLLIAAGGVIAQQTDYADLDGAWLLADDAFSPSAEVGRVSDESSGVHEGVLHLKKAPGFGVEPVPGLFPL
jgi:L-alanine-DL-glutamate epimerase-like enolase superfamily enzyme